MDRDGLKRLRQQVEAVIASGAREAQAALAEALAEALARLRQACPALPPADTDLGRTLDALLETWHQGAAPPARLPGDPDQQARLAGFLADLLAVQHFAVAMAKGELSDALTARGMMAGSLKGLQASLRHLTWQTRMIAQGNLGLRVDFMGEFAEAFNSMVQSLAEARDQLQRQQAELAQANASLRAEVAERLRAEEALRAAHDGLERRVQERTCELSRANQALEAEVAERQRAEEELRASRELLRALAAHRESVREEEQARIARELHDQLGQELTALKIDLVGLLAKLPDDQAELRERTRGMVALADASIKSVRRIVTELRPGVLEDLGLAAALKWELQQFQGRTGVECRLELGVADRDLDRERSTALFRILQEALTNVARHANATRVDVSVTQTDRQITLMVRDNGRGIHEAALANGRSFGLLGMRERAHLLGGALTIGGGPAGGTAVTAVIPRPAPGATP